MFIIYLFKIAFPCFCVQFLYTFHQGYYSIKKTPQIIFVHFFLLLFWDVFQEQLTVRCTLKSAEFVNFRIISCSSISYFSLYPNPISQDIKVRMVYFPDKCNMDNYRNIFNFFFQIQLHQFSSHQYFLRQVFPILYHFLFLFHLLETTKCLFCFSTRYLCLKLFFFTFTDVFVFSSNILSALYAPGFHCKLLSLQP